MPSKKKTFFAFFSIDVAVINLPFVVQTICVTGPASNAHFIALLKSFWPVWLLRLGLPEAFLRTKCTHIFTIYRLLFRVISTYGTLTILQRLGCNG